MSISSTVTPEELLRHRAWLQRLALRLVDRATADDLVQETWAAAVRANPDPNRPLRPWLGKVLRNLARMRARGIARWNLRTTAVIAATDHPLPSPEELLSYHEAQRLVAEAVAELEEPYRSTVLLCYAQEIPPAEIARRDGIPGGTVRWRLKHGLDQLRARLDVRHGNRQMWTAALGPLVAVGRSATVPGAALVAAGGAGRAWLVKGMVVAAGAAAIAALVAVTGVVPASNGVHQASGVAAERRPALRPSVPRLVVPQAASAVPGEPPPAGGEGPGRAGGGGGAMLAAVPAVPPDRKEALARAAEPGDSPSLGDPAAPVTIVVYSEFQCPFCTRAAATMRELMAAHPKDVRLVWKNLPLAFHESAGLAAEAVLAAHEQGKFWAMHDRLFAQPQRLDPEALEQHARALGLDVARWKAAFDGGKYRARVAADLKLASEAGINGAPSFLINGELMMGAQPLAAFQQRVQSALAAARGLPAAEKTGNDSPFGPNRAPGAAVPGPGGARVPPAPGMIVRSASNPGWPPVSIDLPDAVLGNRVSQRFVTSELPVRGNAQAPVQILYFTDMACPDCTRTRMLLDGLLSTHGEHVRVMAKVVAPPEGAKAPTLPAEVALAAHAQGKFWAYHDALGLLMQLPADRARLEEVAIKAGLDADELRAGLDDGRFRAAMEEDRELIKAAGVGPTALVVNGRVAESAVSLLQLVESGIRKAGRRPPPRPAPRDAPELNPRAPGYDPQRLLMQVTPRQLFAWEHKDDVWAAPVEKELGGMIARDLRAIEPKLGSTALSCRASLCRLRITPGGGDRKQLHSAVRFLFGHGLRQTGDDIYITIRGGDVKTPADALARLKSRRSSLLYTHRTGRASQPAPFPIERLLAE